MTIKYALTRIEIVSAFFQGLIRSPKFPGIILLYSAFLCLLTLATSGAFSRPLTSQDAIRVLETAAAVFLLIPIFLFLRGKTRERTLTISKEGIYTQIDSLKGQVPWAKIAIATQSGAGVLVVGRSGNAFLIPSRAFDGDGQRETFIALMNQWRSDGRLKARE